jgi:hypothetical protein
VSRQEATLTFFANERVVTIIGVICIAQSSMGVFEFKKLVSMLARVARTVFYMSASHERCSSKLTSICHNISNGSKG